jgi:hypothetical protein
VSEDELKAIDAEVREIVNEAADFAEHDPEPDPSELWTDVYAEAGAELLMIWDRSMPSSADARALADHGGGQRSPNG